MSHKTEAILAQVLALSSRERALIAEQLLVSLDLPDTNIDHLWEQEIERRLEAYQSGQIKAVPLRDVLAKYR